MPLFFSHVFFEELLSLSLESIRRVWSTSDNLTLYILRPLFKILNLVINFVEVVRILIEVLMLHLELSSTHWVFAHLFRQVVALSSILILVSADVFVVLQ